MSHHLKTGYLVSENRLPVTQKNPIESHGVYHHIANSTGNDMSVVFAFSDIFTTPTTHHPGHSWLRDVGISCKPLAAHTPGHFLSSIFWEARPITWRTLSKSPVSFQKHLTSSNQSLRYQEAVDIRPNPWFLFNQRLVVSCLSSLSCSRAFGTSWQSKMATSERLGGWAELLLEALTLKKRSKSKTKTHRIHGAGIYANMTGVYWWDPCYHIWQHHGSYGKWCPVLMCIAWSIPFFFEVYSSWRPLSTKPSYKYL